MSWTLACSGMALCGAPHVQLVPCFRQFSVFHESGRERQGVCIARVLPGTPAAACGQMRAGDKVSQIREPTRSGGGGGLMASGIAVGR